MAGGEAWLLFTTWRYGHEDPWRTRHSLDSSYRRIDRPRGDELRPQFVDRYRSFLFACGKVAAILDKTANNVPYIPPRRRSRAAGA